MVRNGVLSPEGSRLFFGESAVCIPILLVHACDSRAEGGLALRICALPSDPYNRPRSPARAQ
jgi:hypothetical protein